MFAQSLGRETSRRRTAGVTGVTRRGTSTLGMAGAAGAAETAVAGAAGTTAAGAAFFGAAGAGPETVTLTLHFLAGPEGGWRRRKPPPSAEVRLASPAWRAKKVP